MYFIVRTIASIVVHSFFREITLLNKERIPLYGPVIFVGNHNNQFVDASMLLAMLPRHVRFLVAEKSLNRAIIGRMALAAGSIAVARPQDKVYRGLGFIYWEKGSQIIEGVNTHFLLDLRCGDKIKTMEDKLSVTVKEILSNFKVMVNETLPAMSLKYVPRSSSKPELSSSIGGMADMATSTTTTATSEHGDELTSEPSQPMQYQSSQTMVMTSPLHRPGYSFSVVPRVDQSDVYGAVADALVQGDSIGIFPEGGSHDRLELLPLKPGVAIMALTAAAEGAEDVMIVPLGLNYYQAHKILSRAIIQVGKPLIVPEDLVSLFQTDRRAAVSGLMTMIEEILRPCIISAPSYKALKIVRLCVTLYVPESQYLSPDQYHTLYHQFSELLSKQQLHPRITSFVQAAQDYANLLKGYGIEDHEVRQLKQSAEGAIFAMLELFCIFLLAAIIGLLPGLLWGPVRIMSSYLAEQHRKAALAGSTVKITGRDVVASYKILTLMVLVPCANLLYSFIFGVFYCKSWSGVLGCIIIGLAFLPCVYYHSIRYFAMLPSLLRKFRFLFLVLVCKLNAWRENEKEIITRRMQMQLAVRELVQVMAQETGIIKMSELERCVPEVVCIADSKRINRRLGDFIPISARHLLECREEIL